MMELAYILDNRAMSSYGVSVGTAMVLESIFEPTSPRIDDTRVAPVKIKISDYKVHYYNVETVIRNIINAVPTMAKGKVLKSSKAHIKIMEILWNEFNVISELYADTGCKPVIMVANYQKIAKNLLTFKHESDLKGMKLDLSVIIEDVKHAIRSGKFETDITIAHGDHTLPRTNDRTLITSHIALDLLNIKRIPKLELLESHTGKLKKSRDFNTKYHKLGKNDMTIFPFTERLLYLLGDDSYIGIQPLEIRRALYDIATSNKWSAFTSEFKINENVGKDTKVKILYYGFKMVY